MDYVDILIIGGGPAGAVSAGILAKEGFNVLLLESKKFPREHIGESLLAVSLPYLKELGVLEKLKKEGYLKKHGSIFRWGEEMVLDMPSPGYSYQVKRASFDKLLMDHCIELGATVEERARVKNVNLKKEGLYQVDYLSQDQKKSIMCNFVLDASGQSKFLARQFNKEYDTSGYKRSALSTYFKGAGRRSERGNDIITEATTDGWLWFIPLDHELTSVGFVGDELDTSIDIESYFNKQVSDSEVVKELVEKSIQINKPKRLNYSNYILKDSLWGERYAIIGDAGFFVDPLFSTGVHGAIYSGYLAAKGVTAVLNGKIDELKVSTWYDKQIRTHYNRIKQTVRLLYGTYPGNTHFWESKNLNNISLEEANALVQQLGVQGATFFINANNNKQLCIPDNIRVFIDEIIIPKPISKIQITTQYVPTLKDSFSIFSDLMVHKGKLETSVNLIHKSNITQPVSFVENSLQAKLINASNGKDSIQSISDGLNLPEEKMNSVLTFFQTMDSLSIVENNEMEVFCK